MSVSEITRQAGRDALRPNSNFLEFLKEFVNFQVRENEHKATDILKSPSSQLEYAKLYATKANVYETLINDMQHFADKDE